VRRPKDGETFFSPPNAPAYTHAVNRHFDSRVAIRDLADTDSSSACRFELIVEMLRTKACHLVRVRAGVLSVLSMEH